MKGIIGMVAAASLMTGVANAEPVPSTTETTTYHRVDVDGTNIFYREAGPKGAPTIVLLHGFPSSSREYDPLIPLLATRYHVIAPDFPGFGQSDRISHYCPCRHRAAFATLSSSVRPQLANELEPSPPFCGRQSTSLSGLRRPQRKENI